MTIVDAVLVIVYFLIACTLLFVSLSIFLSTGIFRKRSKLDIGAAIVMMAGALSCFWLAHIYAS